MAETYPIEVPALPVADCVIRAVTADSISESPFTFKQQVQKWPGERWEMDITTPRMNRDTAERWITFLNQLDGRRGTFLYGDPRCPFPRGTMRASPPSYAQANRLESFDPDPDEFACLFEWDENEPPNPLQTPLMLAGDLVQLGVGAQARLYKLTKDLVMNNIVPGSGQPPTYVGRMQVWPHPPQGDWGLLPIQVFNAKGLWRLATNTREWMSDSNRLTTISFSAVQAIV